MAFRKRSSRSYSKPRTVKKYRRSRTISRPSGRRGGASYALKLLSSQVSNMKKLDSATVEALKKVDLDKLPKKAKTE